MGGGEGPRREADHLSPSGAGAKNEWSYTFTSLYSFMAYTGRFSFIFILD